MSSMMTTAEGSSRPQGGWFAAQHKVAPYLFVAPFVLLFIVFSIYPIIQSVILAFYTTVGPKDQQYVGLGNFSFMFHQPEFWTSVTNTVVYTLCSVFIQLPLALCLALLMNQPWLKGRSFFRLAIFSPNLIGLVFTALLFTQLFAAHFGLVNQVLHWVYPKFDVETKWTGDDKWIMPGIVLISLWLYSGYNMVYFLAGLQAVDKELYEAAMVDGANSWQQFLNVTIPGIKPVMIFVLVTATIGSFQLFDLPYILLSNGPGTNNAGETIVMYLYLQGFQTGDLGFASAIGWTLAIAILLISLLQVWLTGAAKGSD